MVRPWAARARAVLNPLLAAVLAIAVATPGLAASRFPMPRPDTDEYRKSWPLQAIGAQAAYQSGLSGRGVRIAVVDCGLQQAQRELLRNVSPESTDVVGRRVRPIFDRHGAWVADPLVAALDGRGMVGVAYKATLVAIRADLDGGYEGECAFHAGDLARALDYATEHRARIVVLPMQAQNPLGAAFEAALGRLVRSGAVVVISAGNHKGDQPAWPARYAADPRFAGSVIVAGAATYYGDLANWSNRAGDAMARYVVAPGEFVLTDCGRKCKLASGTSFSAPYVAGAIALMMEAHPSLSGPEAAERVLAAARDAGAPGPDAVYGRGILDLARAFPSKPTGRVSASQTAG